METRTQATAETFDERADTRKGATDDWRGLLDEIERALAAKPFKPHPLFRNKHAMTLAAYVWPRRFRLRSHRADEARLFEIEPGVKVLAHCRWQPRRQSHPTLLLLHGLEGSSISIYMLETADKAFRAGFNIVRMNMRTCGGTEHLTPTLYNSGMSGDIRAVIEELVERDGLSRIYLAGWSMGGNLVLKLAGESGDETLAQLAGICAISPAIDLHACVVAIEQPANWLYENRFMSDLRSRVRRKSKLHPDLYDTSELKQVRTVRDFDNRFTARDGGYADAEDYYTRASSLPLIPRIRKPTLIIHAQDDPFVPFDSFLHPSIEENPNVILLAPPFGGHVAFLADRTAGEDRFWAENRTVEFFRLLEDGREQS